MKLSIVVSACVTLTGCGAADPAFVQKGFGVVAEVGGKKSNNDEVDAGRAGTGELERPDSGAAGTGGPLEGASTESSGGIRSEAAQATPVTDSVVSLGDELVGSSGGRTGVPEVPVDGGTGEGGVPAPTPAPVPNTPPGGVDESRNLPAQCKSMGGPGTRIHVVSSNARIVSPESTVIVAHVNGNQGKLALTLGGLHGYKGLCLLVNGNRGSADVTIETAVGAIVYAGHGNQSSGNVYISNAGSVGRANVKLSGGGARLLVDSVHTAECSVWSVDKVRGKGSAFTCH